MKQVDKKHYRFGNYSHPDRWASYFYQLREITALKPSSVLEVGVGDRVVGDYIKNNTDIVYKSMDIDAELGPDMVGDVRKIPAPDGIFDIVCAFEVLEHVPFEEAKEALAEMSRVSRKHVIISVPHFGPPVKILFKMPLLPEIKMSFKIPYSRKHTFNGEHYWELGKKSFSVKRFRDTLSELFDIIGEFVPFENQYHHFFVLRKKNL